MNVDEHNASHGVDEYGGTNMLLCYDDKTHVIFKRKLITALPMAEYSQWPHKR